MKWTTAVVVATWLAAVPSMGAAAEPETVTLSPSWVMDVPVTGEHAVELVRTVTAQLDQSDFVVGEWRQYQVGLSKVNVRLTLMHRYDGASADFPVPAAGAEEWSMELWNPSFASAIEWTTSPGDRTKVTRLFTKDDRLHMLPRAASDPRVALQAALQHARLDAMHPHAALTGILRGGYPVWQPVDGDAFSFDDRGHSVLPRLLITASGYNSFRSKLGRDATMGPACIGWQTCGEHTGVAASR